MLSRDPEKLRLWRARSKPLEADREATRAWQDRSRQPLPKEGRRGRAMRRQLDGLWPELRRRSRGRCEIAIPGVCEGEATERCHRQRRRETNNTLANVMHGCRSCHKFTEQPEHRALCLRHGFILESGQDPELVPWFPLPLGP